MEKIGGECESNESQLLPLEITLVRAMFVQLWRKGTMAAKQSREAEW